MELESKFKIIDISDINESKYGKTLLIKANPIRKLGLIEGFTPYECDETVRFILPLSMANDMVYIAKNYEFWKPEAVDYIKETIFHENDQKQLVVYRHMDFHKEEPFLKYYVKKIGFSGEVPQIEIEEEHWAFDKELIKTPYGNLGINSFMDVESNGQIGIQLSTSGMLRLNDLKVEGNPYKTSVFIKTFALVRQPYNAWVWAWLFDRNDNPIMSIFGFDNIDDNLQKYQSDLHDYYQ